MKKRLIYLIVTILILIIEVMIALFVHDKFVRPYIGDVLVTILICSFLRIFIPKGVKLLPLYVFIFAAGVEVLQYFRIVELLGLSDNRFFSILIGSVFDVKDVVCYGIGCVIFFFGEKIIKCS
jgi:predicted membrane channel-forming protein YqfA (hemolysin III family)